MELNSPSSSAHFLCRVLPLTASPVMFCVSPALALSQMFHGLGIIPLQAAALMFGAELSGCRALSLQHLLPRALPCSQGQFPVLESLQGSDVGCWGLSSTLEILRFLGLHYLHSQLRFALEGADAPH